ncbi:hypothetical protein L1987_60329 [Smallanthus sonchifolius]|uniref:Uncharacterized protein n=1 Tax=Smallanthus sonchifolius TaxID=185202 RepID=A0ACB9D7U6_9ASTR|nr:hypothetical protein L1987_60329 [Smallanthus sonchifolius]
MSNGKASVYNGNYRWTETLSESIWISHDDSTKELQQFLYKLIISKGSTSKPQADWVSNVGWAKEGQYVVTDRNKKPYRSRKARNVAQVLKSCADTFSVLFQSGFFSDVLYDTICNHHLLEVNDRKDHLTQEDQDAFIEDLAILQILLSRSKTY